ncbi:hypothetical protein KAS08_03645 [Candidatus Pacearchaeota archaeon]|nr:hypothetical protein [Candidatus Pacearchaeota archaeon]
MRRVCLAVLLVFVLSGVLAEGSYYEALDGLITADNVLFEMESEGFSVFFIRDSLLEAKKFFIGLNSSDLVENVNSESDEARKDYLEDLIIVGENFPSYERQVQDYSEVLRLTDVIVQRREQAYRILDGVSLFEEKAIQYRDEGVLTEDALVIVENVKVAFEGERYDDAEKFLEDANLKLNELFVEKQKIGSAIRATQGFFIRYWWQSLLVLAGLIAIAIPAYKRISKKLKERQLGGLKVKLSTTKDLLKRAQENCFNAKTITLETYRIREKRYKDNMVTIENKIKILEKILGISKAVEEVNGAKAVGLKIVR